MSRSRILAIFLSVIYSFDFFRQFCMSYKPNTFKMHQYWFFKADGFFRINRKYCAQNDSHSEESRLKSSPQIQHFFLKIWRASVGTLLRTFMFSFSLPNDLTTATANVHRKFGENLVQMSLQGQCDADNAWEHVICRQFGFVIDTAAHSVRWEWEEKTTVNWSLWVPIWMPDFTLSWREQQRHLLHFTNDMTRCSELTCSSKSFQL